MRDPPILQSEAGEAASRVPEDVRKRRSSGRPAEAHLGGKGEGRRKSAHDSEPSGDRVLVSVNIFLMRESEISLDRALAEWVLGRITPEQAQELAVRALQEGCTSRAAAIIAGLDTTSTTEIDDELPGLLREFGKSTPSRQEALKTLVDDCATQIADGRIDPVEGARMMWDYWVNEDESTTFYRQVESFIDLVVAADDDSITTEQCAQSVAEAQGFLRRGGLQQG
jgi:hypothetical protein